MIKTLPIAFFAAAGIAVASAAVQDPITIKFAPTKGQVFTYSMSGSIELQSTARAVEAKRIGTILDVSADGSYKEKWEEQDVTVDGNGQPDQAEETTVSKPTGEIVSNEIADMGRTAAMDRLYYPTSPVKVGEAWAFEGKKDDKLGMVAFKADMKLLGDEKVGDIDTWKIQEDLKESEGTTPATLHDTFWVDKKDGSVVKLESKFSDYVLTSAVPTPVNGTLTYLRK